MIEVNRDYQTEKFGNEEYDFNVYCGKYNRENKIVLYSFGIGEDLSFSHSFAKKFPNCEIYAFDPTPKAIAYVDTYDKSVFSHFQFYPFGLSNSEEKTKFYLPKNPDYVSGSEIENLGVSIENAIEVQMHSLGYLMNMLNHISIDLVKMDIEGSEFKVLPQILEQNIEIGQICVEFHNRFFDDGDAKLSVLLEQMKNYGYLLIHVSDNCEEFTFIQKHIYER